LPDAKGDESTWDIRGDLSFVHLYCTDEHLRRVGEQIWDRSPASFSLQEQTFSGMIKSPPSIASFCSIATGSSRPTS
jgi:AraC family transcriptional regulator